MKNKDAKFRIQANTWLLPEAENVLVLDKNYEAGDLVIIKDRPLLVLDKIEHETKPKKVLIQWAGDNEKYWISYDIFIKLTGEKNG